jgi:hypothetical protein
MMRMTPMLVSRLRERWQAAPRWMLYALLALVMFLGLNIAVLSAGVVPGYDALSYLNLALRVNLSLSGQFSVARLVGSTFYTNTLDAVLLGLVYNLIDYHIGVWLIHSAYLLLFAYFLRRIFSASVTLLVVAWAVSHTYFLHQYTSFISEMKVGMFLALFVAFLFHPEARAHRRSLFWITVILLLLRCINLLFLLPLAAVFLALRWRERRAEAFAVLQPVGLALLVLSPLLALELSYLIPYIIREGFGETAQNWRDMSGMTSRWSVLESYWTGLKSYNATLAWVVPAVGAAGLVALVLPRGRFRLLRDYAIGTLVVFAVLMTASTSNLMVVYWAFILFGLLCATLLMQALPPGPLAVLACACAPFAVAVNYANYLRMTHEIVQARPIADMTEALVSTFRGIDKPLLCQNYAGIAPLDVHGMEVKARRTIPWPRINAISYKTELATYVEALNECNVAFAANRNFMWPDFLGVNHKTEELAAYMAGTGVRSGWIAARRVLFDGDPTRYIDVYLRPTLDVKLKYLPFNDRWMDAETPVLVKADAAAGTRLDGYRMQLEVVAPGVEDAGFQPPITASLHEPSGRRVATSVIAGPGPATLDFPLDGLAPGAFLVRFDKTFAPRNDPRRLAAAFVQGRLVYRAVAPQAAR